MVYIITIIVLIILGFNMIITIIIITTIIIIIMSININMFSSIIYIHMYMLSQRGLWTKIANYGAPRKQSL